MRLIFAFIPLAIAFSFCNLANGGRTSVPQEQRPLANQTSSTPKRSVDREALKNELLSIANNMAEASKDGDISFLAQNTTDDFELTDVQGKVQNKNKGFGRCKSGTFYSLMGDHKRRDSQRERFRCNSSIRFECNAENGPKRSRTRNGFICSARR